MKQNIDTNKLSTLYNTFFASSVTKWLLYIFYPVITATVSLLIGNIVLSILCLLIFFTLEFTNAHSSFGGIFDKAFCNEEFVKSSSYGGTLYTRLAFADFLRRLASTAFAVFVIFIGCYHKIAIIDTAMITAFMVAIAEMAIYFINKSFRADKIVAIFYIAYALIGMYVVIYYFIPYKLALLFVTLLVSTGLIYFKFRLFEKKVGEMYYD